MDYIIASRLLSDRKGKTEHFDLDDLTDFQNKLIETMNKNITVKKDLLKENGFSPHFVVMTDNVIALIISCTSAYLAWSCNSKLLLNERIGLTVLAFLFGMFYLVYSITFIMSQCSKDNINYTTVAVAPPPF